jgi:hypothetical protein
VRVVRGIVLGAAPQTIAAVERVTLGVERLKFPTGPAQLLTIASDPLPKLTDGIALALLGAIDRPATEGVCPRASWFASPALAALLFPSLHTRLTNRHRRRFRALEFLLYCDLLLL